MLLDLSIGTTRWNETVTQYSSLSFLFPFQAAVWLMDRCFSHLGRQSCVYSWEQTGWLFIKKHKQRQSRTILNLCCAGFGLTRSGGKSTAQGIAHRGMTEAWHTLSQHGTCPKLCQWRAECYTLWPCPRYGAYITGKCTRDTEGIFRWPIWPLCDFFESFKRRWMQSWFTVSQLLSVKQE